MALTTFILNKRATIILNESIEIWLCATKTIQIANISADSCRLYGIQYCSLFECALNLGYHNNFLIFMGLLTAMRIDRKKKLKHNDFSIVQVVRWLNRDGFSCTKLLTTVFQAYLHTTGIGHPLSSFFFFNFVKTKTNRVVIHPSGLWYDLKSGAHSDHLRAIRTLFFFDHVVRL